MPRFDIDRWMDGATEEEARKQVEAAEKNVDRAIEELLHWERAYRVHFPSTSGFPKVDE